MSTGLNGPAGALSDALADSLSVALAADLAAADADLAERFPGPPATRHPVHTLYLPAERVHADVVAEVGAAALEAFDAHLPDAAALVTVFGDVRSGGPGIGGDDDEARTHSEAAALHALVRGKLEREPVEDLRIDFEDGFTQRGVPAGDLDRDEDAHVDRVLADLLTSHAAAAGRGPTSSSSLSSSLSSSTSSSLPPFWGLRFGSLDPATRRRGIRTFTRFVSGLAAGGGLPGSVPGGLPGSVRGDVLSHFRPTLPKVTSVDQVRAMVRMCRDLEQTCGLAERSIGFEIQIETPQSICGPDGSALAARLVHASDRRCIGLHYGTYDYSAACGIAAEYQAMDHPAADHAKSVMQVAAAGTGVALSDGSTNQLPVGDRADVHEAWRLHARLVDRSLRRGFYQGWDLHPAQLVSRYVATYAFYRRSLPAACARIAAYLGTTPSRAPVAAGYLDEPATARALADFCLRALDCGATTTGEVAQLAGVDRATLDRLRRPGTGQGCNNDQAHHCEHVPDSAETTA
ncbi:MAG: aldolase [Dietzia psychralcaliphila]